MGLLAGTLIVGNEIYDNSTTIVGGGRYSVDDVTFFPVNDSNPTAVEVTIEADIIDGDTFQTLSNLSFNRFTDVSATPIHLGITTQSFSALPSSIIVNWKVRVTGDTSTLDNVSNTIPFTGDIPITNKLISVQAENGQTLNNIIVTQIDFDELVNVLPIFNAIIISQQDTTNTANTLSVVVIEFASQNQIIPPSTIFRTTVTAENGNVLTRRISDIDLQVVIAGLPQFNATQTNELASPTSTINGTAIQLLDFAQANQLTQQAQSMDSLVTAENGATQTVVVTVADFNTLQGSLLQWNATITGFLVERNPTHSVLDVESFAQLNQIIPPNIIPVGSTTVNILNTSFKPITAQGENRVKGTVDIDLVSGGFTDTINLKSWITQIGDSIEITVQNLSRIIIPSDIGLFRFDDVRLTSAPFNIDGLELHTEARSGTTGQIIGTDSVIVPWQGTIPPKGCDEFTDNVLFDIGFGSDSHLVQGIITADDYCNIVRPVIIPPVFLSKAFNVLTPVTKTGLQVVTEIETHLLEHIDTGIEDTSVSIIPSDFELIDGRLKGQIKYIANANFNPLYFGSEFHVGALVQYTGEDNINRFVEQTLNFTETERDENQTINENAFGNRVLKVTFFVLSALNVPFAKSFGLTVSEGIPPCPVGFHQENGVCIPDEKPTGKVVEIIKGVFFGTMALALLSSRGR